MTDLEIDGLELQIAFESITGLCLVTSSLQHFFRNIRKRNDMVVN
ncbi:hypothetical protein SAMN00777080_0966 [Aquiflexum balticum DSM 16537]|uniref:Uncharacterized protein n=1 Tax=Aquiflexum balticum DSM 16537 TaxID=758820 RepID=A0A1W2H1Q2_9BACT|nr:hypothetical protein SAMN00777080_0966 [Aquiflexum balticum DSM 16537]